ncbi:hypothetical protein HRbin12_01767 [bacterium HR12]|nr:hypothetical protein HRbin12_01767 [bacterium HR12]
MRREVSVRPSIRKDTWLSSSTIPTSPPSSAPAARAASESARSGTIARASTGALATTSRTARRYESVATSVTPSRLTSSRTPVKTGRASSREAAFATCPTASANTAAGSVMGVPAGAWTSGKSSAGSRRRDASYAAQRIWACPPSASNSTGASDRFFTVSPRRRAGTSAVPPAVTSTSTVSLAETSRSVVVSVSPSPTRASSSTPVSAGMPGREETPRWTACSASDSRSRSQRNFTCPPPHGSFRSCSSSLAVVGPVETWETGRAPSVRRPCDMGERRGTVWGRCGRDAPVPRTPTAPSTDRPPIAHRPRARSRMDRESSWTWR